MRRSSGTSGAGCCASEILSGAIAVRRPAGRGRAGRPARVSRTPVREALPRLAAEGLVELQPNRGARVADLVGPRSCEKIFELRLRLEPYAVAPGRPAADRRAARRTARAGRPMLRTESRAGRRTSTRSYELNRRFHATVHRRRPAPRRWPPRCAASPTPSVVHQNFHDYAPAALRRSLHHHVEMVAAPRAGDGDWAEAIMRAHLYNARATMLGPPPTLRRDAATTMPRATDWPTCRWTTCASWSSASCWPGRSAGSCSATSAPR